MKLDKNNKKKNDSPDLSQTPTQHFEQEEPTYTVINGDDIQALAIKEDDLQKVFNY